MRECGGARRLICKMKRKAGRRKLLDDFLSLSPIWDSFLSAIPRAIGSTFRSYLNLLWFKTTNCGGKEVYFSYIHSTERYRIGKANDMGVGPFSFLSLAGSERRRFGGGSRCVPEQMFECDPNTSQYEIPDDSFAICCVSSWYKDRRSLNATFLLCCCVYIQRHTQFNRILPFWWYTHNKLKPMAYWYWIAVCLSELNENWTKSRVAVPHISVAELLLSIDFSSSVFSLKNPKKKDQLKSLFYIVDPIFPDVSVVFGLFAVRKKCCIDFCLKFLWYNMSCVVSSSVVLTCPK